ncbi:MAG TPA: hypothetical protein VN851_12080 [Thermoanaerobaculia bacterium]|nr:hypothetical protein [Thermoanaerobaculia bacterium]
MAFEFFPRRKTVWALYGLFACLVPGALAAAAGVPSVESLTRSADFIFLGSVIQAGAANLSIVEPSSRTAIARVEEVLHAGRALDDFTGREVTVLLRAPLVAGDRRVFFTQVQFLGESLGVREIGRARGTATEIAAAVRGARERVLEQGLAARLAAADLVISGRVLETRAIGGVEPQAVSEHDPLWREALLEVDAVFKGKAGERTVSFLYPSSLDVFWASVPKPQVGQKGTWLLHLRPAEEGAAVYAALEPSDLLTAAEAKAAAGRSKP